VRGIHRQVAREHVAVGLIGGQPLHVLRIVRLRVARVQAQEAVGGGRGAGVVQMAEAGIDQVELGLLGVLADRVMRLQRLQVLRCGLEVAGAQAALRGLVVVLFRHRTFLAAAGAAGKQGHAEEDEQTGGAVR